ncbi:MAG: hypothetical protein ACHQ2Y_06055 [Candidatus Lutacidiplasmatales archaeon]
MAASDADVQREATTWLGVGAFGVLLAAIGIYIPALSSVPFPAELRIVLAVGGGAIAVYGFSTYWDARIYEAKHPIFRPLKGRAKDLTIAPSFEVYDPKLARAPPPPTDVDGPRGR